VTRQRPDLLVKLEQDVLDPGVQLSDLLRTCIVLAGRTQAAHLREWATAELNGYPRISEVPEYRKIAAPIMQVIDIYYRGRATRPLNVHSLPDAIREHISEIVPLNQAVGELEALVLEHEALKRQIELGVFADDAYVAVFTGTRLAATTWWPCTGRSARPLSGGVLDRIRTALTEFVVELRSEVGDSGQLPSAEQTDEALRAAVPWAVFNNSTVQFMTTKEGDIMPDGDRTTIKDNKVKIENSSGNFAVAASDVTQVSTEGIDIAKVREFVELINQIGPTLGLAEDQQAELYNRADELREAAFAPAMSMGVFAERSIA
jgi:hypothetical protein